MINNDLHIHGYTSDYFKHLWLYSDSLWLFLSSSSSNFSSSMVYLQCYMVCLRHALLLFFSFSSARILTFFCSATCDLASCLITLAYVLLPTFVLRFLFRYYTYGSQQYYIFGPRTTTFTLIALSENYDTWVAQWIATFSTNRSYEFDLKATRMPIGLATKPIDDRPADLFSPLVAEQYRRVARSSQLLLFRAYRLNTGV